MTLFFIQHDIKFTHRISNCASPSFAQWREINRESRLKRYRHHWMPPLLIIWQLWNNRVCNLLTVIQILFLQNLIPWNESEFNLQSLNLIVETFFCSLPLKTYLDLVSCILLYFHIFIPYLKTKLSSLHTVYL